MDARVDVKLILIASSTDSSTRSRIRSWITFGRSRKRKGVVVILRRQPAQRTGNQILVVARQ